MVYSAITSEFGVHTHSASCHVCRWPSTSEWQGIAAGHFLKSGKQRQRKGEVPIFPSQSDPQRPSFLFLSSTRAPKSLKFRTLTTPFYPTEGFGAQAGRSQWRLPCLKPSHLTLESVLLFPYLAPQMRKLRHLGALPVLAIQDASTEGDPVCGFLLSQSEEPQKSLLCGLSPQSTHLNCP